MRTRPLPAALVIVAAIVASASAARFARAQSRRRPTATAVRVAPRGSATDSTSFRDPVTITAESPSPGAVHIAVDGYAEDCSEGSARPVFDARARGRTLLVVRRGATQRVRCMRPNEDRGECESAFGGMVECPPPLCRCSYSLETEYANVAAGEYDVIVQRTTSGRAETIARTRVTVR